VLNCSYAGAVSFLPGIQVFTPVKPCFDIAVYIMATMHSSLCWKYLLFVG